MKENIDNSLVGVGFIRPADAMNRALIYVRFAGSMNRTPTVNM